MIDVFVNFLTDVVLPIGPLGVFLASILEEVIAPIPSLLIMLGSGFLFVDGPVGIKTILTLVTHVVIPVSLGVALGSLVVYSLARYAGIPIILKWGNVLGVSEEDVHKAHSYFSESKRDDVAIFIARVIPIVPAVVIALGAGLIKMPVGRYLLISVGGTFIRAFILGAIGWQAGSLYKQYADVLAKWENVMWGIIVLLIVGGITLLYRRKRNKYGNV